MDTEFSSPGGTASLQQLLDLAWKLTVGLSVAFYLIGFVVVNFYLRRFGYYSLDLISTQYILAGILALVPAMIVWILILMLTSDRNWLPPESRGWSMAALLFIFTVALIVSLFILVFFSAWIESLSIANKLAFMGLIGLVVSIYPLMLVMWFVKFYTSRHKFVRSDGHSESEKALLESFERLGSLKVGFLLLAISIVLLLLYLSNFSRSLYGEIPATLGGGKPQSVKIVVNDEVREKLANLGIPFLEGSDTSTSIKLLLGTDKEYVFLIGDNRSSVSIDKDLIQAVVFQNP